MAKDLQVALIASYAVGILNDNMGYKHRRTSCKHVFPYLSRKRISQLRSAILRSAFKKKRILNPPIAPLLNRKVRLKWEILGKIL